MQPLITRVSLQQGCIIKSPSTLPENQICPGDRVPRTPMLVCTLYSQCNTKTVSNTLAFFTFLLLKPLPQSVFATLHYLLIRYTCDFLIRFHIWSFTFTLVPDRAISAAIGFRPSFSLCISSHQDS